MNRSPQQLMHTINVASFALDDLGLFLNTHPDCQDAFDLYEQQRDIRTQAIREYTECLGPVTKYNVNTRQGWSWTETPWPWEGGC